MSECPLIETCCRLWRKYPWLGLGFVGVCLIVVPNWLLLDLYLLDEYSRLYEWPRIPQIPTLYLQLLFLPPVAIGVVLVGVAVIGALRHSRRTSKKST